MCSLGEGHVSFSPPPVHDLLQHGAFRSLVQRSPLCPYLRSCISVVKDSSPQSPSSKVGSLIALVRAKYREPIQEDTYRRKAEELLFAVANAICLPIGDEQ